MVHCADFWKKWKKEPNFCGLGELTARNYDKYQRFVEDFSIEFGIPEGIIYLNLPFGAAADILKFKKNSEIRAQACRGIAALLKSERGVTRKHVKQMLGIDTLLQKPLIKPPIVVAASGITKEVRENTVIKDKIRLINAALTPGQQGILLDVMRVEGLDNEYEALTKALIWAAERVRA